MKKNLLFLIPMVVVAVLLSMIQTTGMKVHIILSVAGLLILVAGTFVTKKDWKCPALEIVERVFYAVALIMGIVLMKVHDIEAISIVHKVFASLFTIVLGVCEIHKILKNKN